MSPVLAEFVGTLILIGTIAFLKTPLLIIGGFAAAVLLVGPISGAHLNPAVTTWAFLSGSIGATKAVSYIGAQLLAATSVWLAKRVL